MTLVDEIRVTPSSLQLRHRRRFGVDQFLGFLEQVLGMEVFRPGFHLLPQPGEGGSGFGFLVEFGLSIWRFMGESVPSHPQPQSGRDGLRSSLRR